MTQMNNNFHIRSLIGEEATCWHISENMVSVNWDSGVTEHLWKKDLDKMVACNGWEYIVKDDSPPKDKLPNKFKVYHRDMPTVMSIIVPCNGDHIVATDEDGDVYTWWTVEDMERFLAEGVWVVVPEEYVWVDGFKYNAGDKSTMGNCTFEIYGKDSQAFKDAEKALEDRIKEATADNLLDAIKDFTSGTGHDVFISEGVYKVYRKDEDMPYICHTDEQVVAVMDALITLDEAGKEGEGRFFTLNLEGIL